MGSLVDHKVEKEEFVGKRDWVSVAYFGAAALFCLYELFFSSHVSALAISPLFYYFLFGVFFLLLTGAMDIIYDIIKSGVNYDLIGTIYLRGVARLGTALPLCGICVVCYYALDEPTRSELFGPVSLLVIFATLIRSLISSFPFENLKTGRVKAFLTWTQRLSFREVLPAVFLVYALMMGLGFFAIMGITFFTQNYDFCILGLILRFGMWLVMAVPFLHLASIFLGRLAKRAEMWSIPWSLLLGVILFVLVELNKAGISEVIKRTDQGTQARVFVLLCAGFLYLCLAWFYYTGGPKVSYHKFLRPMVKFDDAI